MSRGLESEYLQGEPSAQYGDGYPGAFRIPAWWHQAANSLS